MANPRQKQKIQSFAGCVAILVLVLTLFGYYKGFEREYIMGSTNMQFQTGDIIFAHGHRITNYVLMARYQTWWSHSLMAYDDLNSVEMTYDNVVYIPLEKYRRKKIRVIRFNLTPEQYVKIRQAALANQHKKFDWLGVMLPIFAKPHEGKYWCNTFIEKVYKDALGWDISVLDISRGWLKPYEKYGVHVVYDYREWQT